MLADADFFDVGSLDDELVFFVLLGVHVGVFLLKVAYVGPAEVLAAAFAADVSDDVDACAHALLVLVSFADVEAGHGEGTPC